MLAKLCGKIAAEPTIDACGRFCILSRKKLAFGIVPLVVWPYVEAFEVLLTK